MERDLVLKPRFNLCPRQWAPVIVPGENGNELKMFRWGLTPSFFEKDDTKYRMFNAVDNTLTTLRTYSKLLGRKHCLIIAGGFYEWRKDGKNRSPHYFYLKSKSPFAFAGLWDRWKKPDGEYLHSFTLITTAPNEKVGSLHDRMGAILLGDAAQKWLDCKPETVPECLQLLKPFPDEEMDFYEVDAKLVNSGKVDSPECVRPI